MARRARAGGENQTGKITFALSPAMLADFRNTSKLPTKIVKYVKNQWEIKPYHKRCWQKFLNIINRQQILLILLAVFTKAGRSPTFYNIWKFRCIIIRVFNKLCCRFLKKSKNCQHTLAEPQPDTRTVHASSIPLFNYNHSNREKGLVFADPGKLSSRK